MFRRLGADIIQHIRKNIALYLIILFAMLTGILAGFFTAGAVDAAQRSALMDYLKDFFQNLEQEGIHRNSVFLESLWQNLQCTFFIWLSGLFRFGIPFVLLFVGMRSFVIGFTIGFLVGQYHFGGFLFTLLCILPQTLIYILCVFGIGVLALEHSVDKLKNRRFHPPGEQQKRKRRQYTNKVVILFALLLVGSLLEAYVSPLFFKLFRWVFD